MSVLLLRGLRAADFETCPANIDVQPQKLAKPVPAWTAGQSAGPHYNLWFITLYDGEPKEMASLVPDVDTRLKQGWTLGSSHQSWLECHYTQTSIVLARALPRTIKSCEVTFVPSTTLDGHPLVKQIACK